MYEEVITPGSTTTQYTSYYSLGGNLVGMRRVVGVSSTQYRMVGDHLGSMSLIVDAQPTPQVVQRTYNKPYGEVAYTWSASGGGPTSLTSIGYTGQRLEAESGLMFYGARFYDPALSYFVSSDKIAPDKYDPATRNRFAYALNSPIRYNDPTGYSAEDVALSMDAVVSNWIMQQECATVQCATERLAEYGINVVNECDAAVTGYHCLPWNLQDLNAIIEAVRDIMQAMNLSSAAQFAAAFGTDKTPITPVRSDLSNEPEGSKWTNCAGRVACSDSRDDAKTILIDTGNADGWASNIAVGRKRQEWRKLYLKIGFIHELAHIWDGRNGLRFSGFMHRRAYMDETMNNPRRGYGEPVNTGGSQDQYEDFAEAVAAEVYADDITALENASNIKYPRFPGYNSDSFRGGYVRLLFNGFRPR